jgi:hypothetical protein
MFENRLLRRIFGPKQEKIIGGWRRLPKEELHNLQDDYTRKMRLAHHVARM